LGVITFVWLGHNIGRTLGMICFVFDFILHCVFVLHQCAVARIRPSQSLIDMTFMPEIMGTGVLPLEVKRPGREADHSPPSSAEVKECVELYLLSLYTSSWRRAYLNTGATLPLPFTFVGRRRKNKTFRTEW
jgi:hypothetical protein